MGHVLEAVAREAGVEAEEADDRREAAPEGEFSEVGLDDRAEHDELAHRVRGEPLPEPLPPMAPSLPKTTSCSRWRTSAKAAMDRLKIVSWPLVVDSIAISEAKRWPPA